MKISISIFISLFLFLSCGRNSESQTTVNYSEGETPQIVIDSLLADTSQILMAEFPFFFDSTRILIHPVGFVNVDASRKYRKNNFSKSYNEDVAYDYGMNLGYGNDVLSGNLTYLIFEDVDHNITRPLSDAVLNISRVEYLRNLARKTNRHYLLYCLQDKDTNRDNAINHKDVTAFYISRLDGTGFAKLTAEYHQFDGGKWLGWSLRYYFRTLEDVNKDGEFDKKDKYHYYYIDFSVDTYKLVEYKSVGGSNKVDRTELFE